MVTHRAEQAIRTRQGRTGQGYRLGSREEQAGKADRAGQGRQEGQGKAIHAKSGQIDQGRLDRSVWQGNAGQQARQLP